MKNYYETVIITKNAITLEDFDMIKFYINKTTKEPVYIEQLGKKHLAYALKGCEEGYYYKINYVTKDNIDLELQPFTEYLRQTHNVLKYLHFKHEDSETYDACERKYNASKNTEDDSISCVYESDMVDIDISIEEPVDAFDVLFGKAEFKNKKGGNVHA